MKKKKMKLGSSGKMTVLSTIFTSLQLFSGTILVFLVSNADRNQIAELADSHLWLFSVCLFLVAGLLALEIQESKGWMILVDFVSRALAMFASIFVIAYNTDIAPEGLISEFVGTFLFLAVVLILYWGLNSKNYGITDTDTNGNITKKAMTNKEVLKIRYGKKVYRWSNAPVYVSIALVAILNLQGALAVGLIVLALTIQGLFMWYTLKSLDKVTDVIKTERLILRHFNSNDVTAYTDMWMKKNFYQHLGTRQAIPSEAVPRMISTWESSWGYGLGVYAVVEQVTGKLIGHCGVRGLADGRVEILYAYDDSSWGKGYATEAAKAVLGNHSHRPLIGVVYPENPDSAKVLTKIGFEPNGQEVMFGMTLDSFLLQ